MVHMIKLFIIFSIIASFMFIALILSICIQVKKVEENFYKNQKEYDINNECYISY